MTELGGSVNELQLDFFQSHPLGMDQQGLKIKIHITTQIEIVHQMDRNLNSFSWPFFFTSFRQAKDGDFEHSSCVTNVYERNINNAYLS